MKYESGLRFTDTHVYFWGSYLSNFHPCQVVVEIGGRIWDFPTSEHAFMAFKAHQFGDMKTFKEILFVDYPSEAKRLGRGVVGFDEKVWERTRFVNMRTCLHAKFTHNEELRAKLLDTGDRVLVEGSPIDRVWGVGIHYEDNAILNEDNWRGQNLLGEALMKVRDEL